MGAQGTTTVNFGAAPGGNIAAVATVSAVGIISASLVEAWLYPVATADHSADEHVTESANISIIAGNINTGAATFQIFAFTVPPSLNEYGLWTVAWVWN